MNVAKVSRNDKPALGRSESVGFSRNFVLPEWLAGFDVKNGDLIVEAYDELSACDDEFKGGRVGDGPEKAGFDLSLECGDFLFEDFNLSEICFNFWVEVFESGPSVAEERFKLSFAGEVEALKVSDGMEVGLSFRDNDSGGVVEGCESLSGFGVGDAQLFVPFFLVGRACDELVVLC